MTFYGYKNLEVGEYDDKGRIALLLTDLNGINTTITTNLPELSINDIDEGFINADINCKNKDGKNTIEALKEVGIIKESYGCVKYNLEKYEYVKFDFNKIMEFDPVGMRRFWAKNDLKKIFGMKL